MDRAKKFIKWVLPPCALLGALWVSLAVYDVAAESRPFFTTSSPGGTYTVNLTGRKGRPFVFPNRVNYHVLKGGKPFLPSTHLHSAGGFMDMSFEIGYPDSRWVNENTIQLYREQNLNDGEPNGLVVINKANQGVKYLEVHSVDKFLFFDLQPGAVVKGFDSRPRGDDKSFYVRGEFLNGRTIEAQWSALKPAKGSSGPFTYHIYVDDVGVMIEGPRLEKYKGAA